MNLGRLLGSFMLCRAGRRVPFAAHQVILTAESLSYMPGYGFAVAATSLVGQNLGARKPKRAYQHGMIAARLALMVMGVIALVFLVFPSVIIRIFTSDPQVVGLGALCLRIAAIEQPAIALEMVLAGALRGAGDTRTPAMITTLCTWLLRIPLMYLSIYVFHWGLTAIWIITVIDWVVRASLVIVRFRRGKWQQIAL
ncbi:MATE family efflux transporter [Syntrophaceticus schinkii]|uniref:Probable multidrug resistance protein NorM n=1 Tax=Syntrophaceticus schinkii TaxID=499207 RepID=A0A0B7MIR3_9FIRM